MALSREWDGRLSTAHPLVVPFSTEAAPRTSLEGYHTAAWRMLQYWHELDPDPWPDEVARDPHVPYWSMCFAGMQLFVNVSNPAHSVRRSRNLGEHMLFIVNPRERFDLVAGCTPEGRRVRRCIRARIESYDGVGHCLQLGSYAAGEIEWWQYGIIEENHPRDDRCPFSVLREDGGRLVRLAVLKPPSLSGPDAAALDGIADFGGDGRENGYRARDGE